MSINKDKDKDKQQEIHVKLCCLVFWFIITFIIFVPTIVIGCKNDVICFSKYYTSGVLIQANIDHKRSICPYEPAPVRRQISYHCDVKSSKCKCSEYTVYIYSLNRNCTITTYLDYPFNIGDNLTVIHSRYQNECWIDNYNLTESKNVWYVGIVFGSISLLLLSGLIISLYILKFKHNKIKEDVAEV